MRQIQTRSKTKTDYKGSLPRLLLSFALAALLVSQSFGYAFAADTELSRQGQAGNSAELASTSENPSAPSDEPSFATLDEAAAAGAAAELPSESAAYVDGEVIVVLAGDAPANAEAASALATAKALSDLSEPEVEAELITEAADVALVELPADVSVEDALLGLANDEGVAFVQ
ncbi:MAG: hypothetical protein LBH64_04250, partial [Coriobacteriales bacterium]|nr:hypothetical protein [Coriobacteriales bacterium]